VPLSTDSPSGAPLRAGLRQPVDHCVMGHFAHALLLFGECEINHDLLARMRRLLLPL
jgi:hypothetical protein